MGGRSFDVRNAEPPACVEQMAATPPACFEAKVWRLWLLDSWRAALDTSVARNRISRGVVPDFCCECTQGYRTEMQAAGRCHPPKKIKRASRAPIGETPVITEKKKIRDAYEAAAKTRAHEDAVMLVAEQLHLDVEVVAEVVGEEATA